MKTIALFGGSFDPPHPGHFEMAKYIYETTKADEVWFLFSLNWQKTDKKYTATHHRMAMGNLLAKHYPDMPFVMSDFQDRLGEHDTYPVLKSLEEQHPDYKFIWVMGADNLESFHTWKNFEKIIENFPLAIVDRPPYTERAQSSYTALTYAHLKTAKASDLTRVESGWHFLQNPLIDMSSSNILTDIFNGTSPSDPRFQEVLDYIQEHNLYRSTKDEKRIKHSPYTA